MKKHKSIGGLIRILGGQVREKQALMRALKATPKTRQQVILLKYIETGSTAKAAKFMNEGGMKSATGKAPSATDVRDLILEGHASLNAILLEYARSTFKKNKKSVLRIS
jgi:hypothetical protein